MLDVKTVTDSLNHRFAKNLAPVFGMTNIEYQQKPILSVKAKSADMFTIYFIVGPDSHVGCDVNLHPEFGVNDYYGALSTVILDLGQSTILQLGDQEMSFGLRHDNVLGISAVTLTVVKTILETSGMPVRDQVVLLLANQTFGDVTDENDVFTRDDCRPFEDEVEAIVEDLIEFLADIDSGGINSTLETSPDIDVDFGEMNRKVFDLLSNMLYGSTASKLLFFTMVLPTVFSLHLADDYTGYMDWLGGNQNDVSKFEYVKKIEPTLIDWTIYQTPSALKHFTDKISPDYAQKHFGD